MHPSLLLLTGTFAAVISTVGMYAEIRHDPYRPANFSAWLAIAGVAIILLCVDIMVEWIHNTSLSMTYSY